MKADAYDRMISRVNVDQNGCWLAGHRTDTHGYAQIRVGGRKKMLCHRLSKEHQQGYLTPGLCVLHTCHVRRCVNPEHLYEGTHKDNMRDLALSNHRKGLCAKLTPDDVREIRKSPLSTRKLGKIYGVDGKTIHAAKVRKTWKHIE